MLAIISSLLAVLSTSAVIFLAFQVRSLQRWRSKIDIAIVSDVMEESESLSRKVLATHQELITKGGFSIHPREALAEARRLHGLKP